MIKKIGAICFLFFFCFFTSCQKNNSKQFTSNEMDLLISEPHKAQSLYFGKTALEVIDKLAFHPTWISEYEEPADCVGGIMVEGVYKGKKVNFIFFLDTPPLLQQGPEQLEKLLKLKVVKIRRY